MSNPYSVPTHVTRFGPLFVASLLIAVASMGCATARSPRAVVDMQRALLECRDGREARADLMRTFRTSQEKLDRRQAELRQAAEEIKTARARGEDVLAREAALRGDAVAVQAEYRKLQGELTEAEQQRTARIYLRMKRVLPQLAAAHHVETIHEELSPPARNGHVLDLTAELIRAVDAQPPLSAGSEK